MPMAMRRLAVLEALAMSHFVPQISANSYSNCPTFVPPKRLITPASTTSVSSRNSSFPILFPSVSGLFQIGFPPPIASFSADM